MLFVIYFSIGNVVGWINFFPKTNCIYYNTIYFIIYNITISINLYVNIGTSVHFFILLLSIFVD